MADGEGGGGGGVASVAIVVLVLLALIAGGFMLFGRGSFSPTHAVSANISTPAGPISGTATGR